MDKRYQRNIPLLYAVTIFSSLVFHRGIFVLYLLEVGLSHSEVGILQTSFFWANFLLEVPSGFIGDRIGRKWSVFISLVLLIVNAVGMAVANHFVLFFLLFLIEGAAFAFESGSQTALLYDTLRMLRREKQYVRILSRMMTISSVLLGVGMAIGGMILSYVGWSYVYLAYAISVSIASLIVPSMYERRADIQGHLIDKDDENEITQIKAFFQSTKGRRLFAFLVPLALYEGIMTPYYVYGQRLLDSFGLGVATIALIFGLIQLLTGLVYLAAERVSKLISIRGLITTTMVFVSTLMITNFFGNLYISLLAFFFVSIIPDVADVVIDEYIQRRIPSSIRASLLSTSNLMESVVIGVCFLVFGLLLDELGVTTTFGLMGTIPIACLLLFELHFRRNRDTAFETEETSH